MIVYSSLSIIIACANILKIVVPRRFEFLFKPEKRLWHETALFVNDWSSIIITVGWLAKLARCCDCRSNAVLSTRIDRECECTSSTSRLIARSISIRCMPNVADIGCHAGLTEISSNVEICSTIVWRSASSRRAVGERAIAVSRINRRTFWSWHRA